MTTTTPSAEMRKPLGRSAKRRWFTGNPPYSSSPYSSRVDVKFQQQRVGSVANNPDGVRSCACGPVLAYCTDIRLLAKAVAAADGQVLGVIEWIDGEMAGWAAATGAIDLRTGEPTPAVPAEIHEALVELDEAGYNGYHRGQERFFATKYFGPDRRAAGRWL
jgi:hypothetical protein